MDKLAVTWIIGLLFVLTSCDVSACDTFQCECAAIRGVYANETQSCFFETSAIKNWWRSFQSCQNTAANSFTTGPAIGRLAHVESDLMAIIIRQNISTQSFYIGMRSEDSGKATNLTDYFWWLQLNNNNAMKSVTDLANVTSKSLSDPKENCVMFDAAANEWKDVHCAEKKIALCEIIPDQCHTSNACVAPKVCVPDSNKQVHCVCPNGAVNDINCGVDCSAKPDGSYPVGDCSGHYYTCSSQSATLLECPANGVFDPFHGICSASALACKCEELDYRYVPETQSCMAPIFSRYGWLGSFKKCKAKTSEFEGINGLTGRSVHDTNEAISSGLFDIGNSQPCFNGMRNSPDHFDNTTLLEHYRWWLDPSNSNALLPVTNSDHIKKVAVSQEHENCIRRVTSSGNSWDDMFCGYYYTLAMCEIFYNECEHSDPCPAPKQCVPDVNGQALCFCPNNAVNTSDCTDCSGKPDGDYYLGTCVNHYYTCTSGASSLNQCVSGEVFDPNINACSSTSLECKCIENGGEYFLSTDSCLIRKAQYGNWYKHFKDCDSGIANNFGMDNLYGRLAHVKTADVAAKVIDLADLVAVHMGARALPDVPPAGNETGLANFRWWLDKDNPNAAVDQVDELGYLLQMHIDGYYEDCIRYQTTHYNGWYDDRCSEYNARSAMCEIYHNQCEVSDPCIGPKVCVPDLKDQTRCFCPSGAANTTDCTDCSNKTDGVYAVAICKPYYYTCASRVSSLHQCPSGSMFNRGTNNCTSDVTLECKCQELDGMYLPERMTCVRNMPAHRNWFGSFDYCKSKASDFGVPSLIGRLAHVDSKDIATAMIHLYDYANDHRVWIGARAVQNGSEMTDFHWWFDNDNSNAVKVLHRPDYIASTILDSKIEPCVVHYINADRWNHMDCSDTSYKKAACEFLQNQCDISNPCQPPKVCLPDVSLQTHCFCPAGAINDDTCGVDCTGKANGDYPIGLCVRDYYSCTAGVSTLHQCGPDEAFDRNSQNCSSNFLECNCETEIGGTYVPSKQSCIYRGSSKMNWHFSYEHCIDKAQTYNLPNLVGRLAHLDDSQIVEALVNNVINTRTYLGLRSISDGSSMHDYYWWYDPHNKNAVINTTASSHLTSVIENDLNEQCPYFHTGHSTFYKYTCGDKTDTYPVCEFFENDRCKDGSLCEAPKECYPDVNGQTQCFCPAGAVNDENCGMECSGKSDGDYGIGSCSQHYYSCVSETPILKQCSSSNVFNPHTGVCDSQNNNLACKCTELDGVFDHDSGSCVLKGSSYYETWRQSYMNCQTMADSFGIVGLVGRLAHLTKHELVAATVDISNAAVENNGMHSIKAGVSNALSDFGWWLDLDNNNAYLPVSDVPAVKNQDFTLVNNECGRFWANSQNKFGQRKCAPSYKTHSDACQVFHNQCDVMNPCVAPKVCLPDANLARCFCPNGAINDDDCGVDCSGKADGFYHIGACASDYYSCANEIATMDKCSNNKVLDPFSKVCGDSALACKCIELGGYYIASKQSCLLNNRPEQNWFDSFNSICSAQADAFGIESLIGRLVHIRDIETMSALMDYSKNGYSSFIGMRSIDTTNPVQSGSYFWWFDPHNSNAVLPLTQTFDMDTKFDDPSRHCMRFYHGRTIQNERFYDYPCNQWDNMFAQCEIFYDVCSVSDPCPPPKQCYPDPDMTYHCFCPAGAVNDNQCGVDCSNKTDGVYDIGDNSQYYYTCKNQTAEIIACPEGEKFNTNFKLCATDSVASECIKLDGRFVKSSDSCLVRLTTAIPWKDSFESCQSLAIEEFGEGHRGRLVHMNNDDVASALGDIVHKSHYDWIGLRSEVSSNDIADFRWWNNADNSTNSTSVHDIAVAALNSTNGTYLEWTTSNLTRLSLVKVQTFDNIDHQCALYNGQTHTILNHLCSGPKYGICEVFHDREYVIENKCETEQPCQNNATCIQRTPYDGRYLCECTPEYTGVNCTDPNICVLESPCQSGANCTDGPGEEYNCACGPEMHDKNCSVIDSCYFEPCKNAAQCMFTGHETYVCNCTSEWIMPNCTERAPTCPKDTIQRCNGTMCCCEANRPPTNGIDYRGIGRDVRASEGITVLLEQNKPTSVQCAMVCGSVPQCAFFSYRETTGECILHSSISPGIKDIGFEMFAKIK